MLYEVETFTLRPRAQDVVEKLWQERGLDSDVLGFFHTDFGPLNEVIQVRAYESLAERDQGRTESPGWPDGAGEYIVNHKIEVVRPFPFSPQFKPGKLGPVFELRQYIFRPETLPQIIENWRAALPSRMNYSAPLFVGNVVLGPTLNSFIHIWPYESVAQRGEVRRNSMAGGTWPPAGGDKNYLSQANKLLLPAAFSPTS